MENNVQNKQKNHKVLCFIGLFLRNTIIKLQITLITMNVEVIMFRLNITEQFNTSTALPVQIPILSLTLSPNACLTIICCILSSRSKARLAISSVWRLICFWWSPDAAINVCPESKSLQNWRADLLYKVNIKMNVFRSKEQSLLHSTLYIFKVDALLYCTYIKG